LDPKLRTLFYGCLDRFDRCTLDVHAVLAVPAFFRGLHRIGEEVLADLTADFAFRQNPNDIAGAVQSNAFHDVSSARSTRRLNARWLNAN
jgi:hypothetical protein